MHEIFGRPDVWTIRPTTLGEMNPVTTPYEPQFTISFYNDENEHFTSVDHCCNDRQEAEQFARIHANKIGAYSWSVDSWK